MPSAAAFGSNTDCVDIGKDNYFGLTTENSTVPYEKRELYWKIYEYYKEWLSKSSYFDENDLARWALEEIKKTWTSRAKSHSTKNPILKVEENRSK